MKKGSKARKCCSCGQRIFWIVPTGKTVGFFPIAETQDVKPWLLRENKYWCKECYKKHLKERGA